jgi:hypothetical protein
MDPTRTFLAPAGRGALGSVGEIVSSPLARSLVRYWWLVLPIGYLGYHSWKKNSGKAASAAIADTVTEVAPVVATVATLVMLNHLLAEKEKRSLQQAAGAPMKTAQYTVRPQAAPVRAPALPAPAPAPEPDGNVITPE